MRQSRPKAKPAVTTGPRRPNRKPSGRESGRGLRSRAGPTGNTPGADTGGDRIRTLRQLARIGGTRGTCGTRVPPGVSFFYGSGNPPQVWPCTKKTGLSCLSPVTGWGHPCNGAAGLRDKNYTIRRRRSTARPSRPMPSSMSVAGSGTCSGGTKSSPLTP